jgi:hypothetical protein
MVSHRVGTRAPSGGRHLYYRCSTRHRYGKDTHKHSTYHRAEGIEQDVWQFVSNLLSGPEQLRQDLEEVIKRERHALRGNPERETRMWLDRLAELDCNEQGQDLAVDGHLSHDELRCPLARHRRRAGDAEHELETLSERRKKLEELDHDHDALLQSYAGMRPEVLGTL